MWKNIRFAYKGWFAVIGICVSAFALANFAVRVFEVGPSQVLAAALTWYRQIVHGLLDYLLVPFHVSLTPVQKDLFTLWTMFGGLVSRTVNYIYTAGYVHDFPPNAIGVDRFDRAITDRRAFRLLFLAVSTLLCWPYFVIRLTKKPYLMSAGGLGLYVSDDKSTKNTMTLDTLEFDSRIIFFVYLATLLIAMVAFFALNALLPSVPSAQG